MIEKKFNIIGMSCQHCVMAVKKELSKLNLENFHVEIGQATITYDEKIISEKDVIKAIEEAGYNVENEKI